MLYVIIISIFFYLMECILIIPFIFFCYNFYRIKLLLLKNRFTMYNVEFDLSLFVSVKVDLLQRKPMFYGEKL